MIYLELLWAFIQIGLFSVGGGYAALPLIQAQAVDKHAWLTISEFTDLITIAEMTPGPIAINSATFVGIRVAGFPGALVATLGCILPSIFIVSALAYIYFKYRKMSAMKDILATLRPVVVALIASAGLSILLTVLFPAGEYSFADSDWAGAILFIAAFIILRLKKMNVILTMFSCGVIYLILGITGLI
ncbi:MAG: chromate transporter [Clostridia bacterium]|nr:chromate transporter [Clostridia bacterium]